MTLKEFTDLMCTNVEMSIELRDTDNQEICTCKSGSKGIKPYEDYNVNEWFTVPNNGRVVVTISMAHTFVGSSFEHINLGKIALLCDDKHEEFAKKKAEVKAILEKYKEPDDYEWNQNNAHYSLLYKYAWGNFEIMHFKGMKQESVTYFKTYEDAERALKEAGVENVKKYLFEIKE